MLTESWGPTPATVGLRDGLQALGYREGEQFHALKTQSDSLKLPYPLLSDYLESQVIRQYGVLSPKYARDARRAFFLIDQQGIVRQRWLPELIPRIWTLRVWNLSKSTFLADRFAAQTGAKSWTMNSRRTIFFPRNWLSEIFPPVVAGSVKSGAVSPTSSAAAT